mgnify:CR=1 FL=1
MPPSKRPAAPAARDAPEGQQRRKKPTFDPQRILEAVVGDGATSVASHQPALFADGQAEADWRAWAASVPQRLSDVPRDARPLPLVMPVKFSARKRDQPQQAAPAPQPQIELMTYRNPGGSSYTKKARDRNATAARMQHRLLASEISEGCAVAVVREGAIDPSDPPGYGTPFYIGDVVKIHLKPVASTSTSGDSSAAPATREVAKLDLHYRIPMCKSKFCDDVKRPFKLACVGKHEWNHGCEKRKACVQKREQGATTSRHFAQVEAGAVFEANVQLLESGALSAPSKKRLAERDPKWAPLLGVDVAATKAAKKGKSNKKAKSARK